VITERLDSDVPVALVRETCQMLCASQVTELMSRGVTHIPEMVASDVITDAEERVWEFLATRDIDRDDPPSWPETINKLQPLRKAGVFDVFLTAELDTIFDQLLGPGSSDLGAGPQALMSMPSANVWALPHKQWHMDLPGIGPSDHLNAVRVLGYVADVEPHGGGTLVIEGSAALVAKLVAATPDDHAGRSSEIKSTLSQRHAWFADLTTPGEDRIERFMKTTATIDGIEMRVSELTGSAGDVTLMHPWTIHNIGLNTSELPRMMMSYSRYATH
jgi:hypothetical protein